MWGDDYEFEGSGRRNPRERYARSQAERKEYEEHLLRAVELLSYRVRFYHIPAPFRFKFFNLIT